MEPSYIKSQLECFVARAMQGKTLIFIAKMLSDFILILIQIKLHCFHKQDQIQF